MAVLAQRCAMLVCVAVAVTALCQGVGAFGEHSTSGARELLATTVRVAPTPPPGQSSSGSDTVGCGIGAATPCATIQYAINSAAQFSTILLLPGVHTATGNSTSSCPAAFSAAQASQFYDGITFGGKSLTIKASPPMSASITAQGCGRVFQFVSGETPSAVVRDLQIRDGYQDAGGCVLIVGARPSFINVDLYNCSASSVNSLSLTAAGGGGAVHVNGATAHPTFQGCMIRNSTSFSFYGGGGLRVQSSGHATVYDTTIMGCTAPANGAGVSMSYGSDAASGTFTRCHFVENVATGTGSGGGMSVEGAGVVVVRNSSFVRNKGESAGAIMAHSSGAFLCDACVLSQNENTSPHFGGGAVTAVGPSANPVFNNSVFSHNIGLGPGGAIYVADSAEPVFVNTQFLYNVDLLTAWGGGAAWIQSDAVFVDCDFVGNTCAGGGGAIWMGKEAKAVFSRCRFIENRVTVTVYGGGALRLKQDCAPTFTDCHFIRNNGGAEGGGIWLTGLSAATFRGCVVTDNIAYVEGGGIYVEQQAHPTFADMLVNGNVADSGAGITLAGSCKPTFTNVTVDGNVATDYGGGIESRLEARPVFTGLVVTNNAAGKDGGGLYSTGLLDGTTQLSTFTFNGARFSGNRASLSGGGIRVANGVKMDMVDVNITSNVAGSVGGGIALMDDTIATTCTRCHFASNHAASAGGAVFTTATLSPLCTTWAMLSGFNNSAGFAGGGAYVGASATTVSCAPDWQSTVFPASKLNRAMFYGPAVASAPAALTTVPTRLMAHPNEDLRLQARTVDSFGQLVVMPEDPGAVVGMELLVYVVRVGNTLGGVVDGAASWTVTHNGTADVTGLMLTRGVLGDEINVTLVSTPKLQSAVITLDVSHCPKGLARTQNTDGTFSCTVCPKGSYKIANDGGCHLCPTKGAVCLGGDQIYVTDGFYGIVEGELVGVYRCPNGICCPAFSNSQEQRLCPIGGSSEEICAATRAGFMCGECQDGYSEALGTYLCRNCQDGANVGLVVAGFVALFLGVGIIVYRGRMQGGSRSFLKILILKNALHFYQMADLVVGQQERTHTRAVLTPVIEGVNLRLASSDEGEDLLGVCISPTLTAFDKLRLYYAAPLLLIVVWALLWGMEWLLVLLHAKLCPGYRCRGCSLGATWRKVEAARKRAKYAKRLQRLEHRFGNKDDDIGTGIDVDALDVLRLQAHDPTSPTGASTLDWDQTIQATGVYQEDGGGKGSSSAEARTVRYVAGLWSLLLIMYAGVTLTTLNLLSCRTVAGDLISYNAPTVSCFSGYEGWEYPTFLMLFLFVVPFPGLIALVIWHVRRFNRGQKRSSVAMVKDNGGDRRFAQPAQYPLLIGRVMAHEVSRVYRPHMWWWEAVLMLRRGILIALATSIDAYWTRGVVLNLSLVLVLVTHCIAQPFRLQSANNAETLMLSLLVGVSATVLVPDGEAGDGLAWVRAVMLVLPLTLVVLAIIRKAMELCCAYRAQYASWKAATSSGGGTGVSTGGAAASEAAEAKPQGSRHAAKRRPRTRSGKRRGKGRGASMEMSPRGVVGDSGGPDMFAADESSRGRQGRSHHRGGHRETLNPLNPFTEEEIRPGAAPINV